MSAENVKPLSQPKTYNLPISQAFISGRIDARRKINTQDGSLIFTTLKLPAVDVFSSPDTVEVQSRLPIGSPGEEWSGLVRISGFANNYDSKPDQDGEIRKIRAARNHLVVIEV